MPKHVLKKLAKQRFLDVFVDRVDCVRRHRLQCVEPLAIGAFRLLSFDAVLCQELGELLCVFDVTFFNLSFEIFEAYHLFLTSLHG